jgi:DNA mismatch repair protein MutS2
MDAHALRTLEFPKILDRLARHAAFSAGKELALALTPSTDIREVVRQQRHTAEARRLMQLKPRTGLQGSHDVRPLAEKASRGGILSAEEFLYTASTLECARELKSSIARLQEDLPLLAEVVDGIEPLVKTVENINRSINQRGEVTDQASPALGAIRREVRTLHDRLYQRMQEILSSAHSKGIAQEAIITVRDGRYVIPVKQDYRGQIKGIVHDVSGSGATVWLEPLVVVELGNKWREAQLEEEREVERVLRALSNEVGEQAQAVVWDVEALAVIDLALAKARFGDDIDAGELPYAGEDQSWIVEAPGELHLLQARHPLLRAPVVPSTITLGGAVRVMLITGPNTGGKTVALKTAGLLALMAQAGLPVPADTGTRIPVFEAIFADIGDEQSIEQSLSTFSSHITNIITVLRDVGPKSLVLLDELAAGTDPTEGSALARSILTTLLDAGALVIATTHHGELKAFAHNTAGVTNASVEFDVATLSPTYRLSIGLPGRSNALEIAQRLGMPQRVIDDARNSIAPEQLQVEDLLSDLRRERDQASSDQRAEGIARREAEEIREKLAERLDAAEEERERLITKARAEIEKDVERARRLVAQAEQEIEKQKLVSADEKLKQALEEAVKLAQKAAQPRPARRRREPRVAAIPAGPPPEDIEAGDHVWLRGMDRWGEAISAPDDRGDLEIRLGPLRSRIKLSQVEKVQRVAPSKATGDVHTNIAPMREVPPELEVRGQTVDEALPTVEQYLDEAFRAGLPWARIIHGKGTGTLRRQVREMLAKHPLVKSYEEARLEEGGEGVTIAYLAI